MIRGWLIHVPPLPDVDGTDVADVLADLSDRHPEVAVDKIDVNGKVDAYDPWTVRLLHRCFERHGVPERLEADRAKLEYWRSAAEDWLLVGRARRND